MESGVQNSLLTLANAQSICEYWGVFEFPCQHYADVRGEIYRWVYACESKLWESVGLPTGSLPFLEGDFSAGGVHAHLTKSNSLIEFASSDSHPDCFSCIRYSHWMKRQGGLSNQDGFVTTFVFQKADAELRVRCFVSLEYRFTRRDPHVSGSTPRICRDIREKINGVNEVTADWDWRYRPLYAEVSAAIAKSSSGGVTTSRVEPRACVEQLALRSDSLKEATEHLAEVIARLSRLFVAKPPTIPSPVSVPHVSVTCDEVMGMLARNPIRVNGRDVTCEHACLGTGNWYVQYRRRFPRGVSQSVHYEVIDRHDGLLRVALHCERATVGREIVRQRLALQQARATIEIVDPSNFTTAEVAIEAIGSALGKLFNKYEPLLEQLERERNQH